MSRKSWVEITREERYFTSFLFHDILHNPEPLCGLLRGKLDFKANVAVVDIGYEVCFFRDVFRSGLIKKRQPALEKQTFDLVLWLSTNDLVIIECKAQQGFHNKQISKLKEARDIILQLSNDQYPIDKIYLVALCSEQYEPHEATRDCFSALLTWNEMVDIYPNNKKIYYRANSIYGE